MPFFVKTETFTKQTLKLLPNQRKKYLDAHKSWVKELSETGINISSGYLVDENNIPGGGGLVVLEAESFEVAKSIIQKDPMILGELVNWQLHEWLPVSGQLMP